MEVRKIHTSSAQSDISRSFEQKQEFQTIRVYTYKFSSISV